MSAYIVSDKHISAMLTLVSGPEYHGEPKTYYWDCEIISFADNIMAIGQKLLDENYKSVNARYNRNETPHTFSFEPVEMKPIEIVRLCHCYNYQTCEHDGWDGSEAEEISRQIEHYAIKNVPGYEDAPWGI